MKKQYITNVVAFLIILAAACALTIIPSKIFPVKNIAKHAPVHEFTSFLDKRIPALMTDYRIPGLTIALVKAGEIAWTQAYGYADIDKKRPMLSDAVCRVESISKSVTAYGVIKLVEEERIDLDTPVQNYLGDWLLPHSDFDTEKITVRRLLSHTAGLPLGIIGPRVEYEPGSDVPSLEEFLKPETELLQPPGAGFSYSNSGFNLLELIIEKVTHLSFADYMADEILRPLGIQQSSFAWDENWRRHFPMGYEGNGKPVPPYVYPSKASGGLFATVEDIARFISAGMSGSRAEQFQHLYTAQTDIPGLFGLVANSYGFGHFIEEFSDGRRAVWHGGQGHGWMTHFHSVPETGDGIVILTNSQRSWPVFAYILSDWAHWIDLPSIGMEKIVVGQKITWVIIGILNFLALWSVWRLVAGITSGRREFSLLSPPPPFQQAGQLALVMFCLVLYFWSKAQEYLIINSLFPIAANWLISLLMIYAVILLLYTAFPARRTPRTLCEAS